MTDGGIPPAPVRALQALRRAVAGLARVMGYAAGWVFVLCALFITADVLGRRFLGVSSQSTTELTGYMLAFGIAWGLGHALTERAHVRIDILVDRLPAGPRRWLHLVSLALLAVFVAFCASGASDVVQESWLFGATDISLLRTPLVVPQGLWAFGIGVFFLLIVLMLAEGVALTLLGRGAEVERALHARTYDEEAAEALDAVGVRPGATTVEAKP